MSQCKKMVYVRDTYRRTGRGPTGFEMHYDRRQCKRKAKPNGYCWQHQKEVNPVPSSASDKGEGDG